MPWNTLTRTMKDDAERRDVLTMPSNTVENRRQASRHQTSSQHEKTTYLEQVILRMPSVAKANAGL